MMNRHLIFIYLIILLYFKSPEISICSWNLKDFGNTKSDEEIVFIANTIKDFDIVAIQEVVAGEGGIEAVNRLYEELMNSKEPWDYVISKPTSSSAYKAERYAYLWKKNKVSIKCEAWLENNHHLEIDREPYFATFSVKGKEFTLINFHAITKAKQPETEIKYFKLLPNEYPELKMIFCGDFNLTQSHSVFNPLKEMGYLPALIGQKTSLRDNCLADGCLASEYDNFLIPESMFELLEKGVIHFYEAFQDFKDARIISDHIPIYIVISIK